ncbi:MAG: protein translocase subunit SecD [Dehalococcoidia bacterium]|nr:MAG: protein translocase subunit SecD [Dehalococcoidia bacterium]
MTTRNLVTLSIVMALFAFAIIALVYPLWGREAMRLGLDLQGGIHMVYQADFSSIEPGEEGEAIDGAVAVIERRINILGVAEPMIQKQGTDRILVELPGISEADKAKKLIGQTALIEFRELKIKDGEEEWIPVTAVIGGQEKELNSAYFRENTYVSTGQFGEVLLVFEWNKEGQKLSEEITGRLIGEPLGIYLSGEPLLGDDGVPIAPIIRSVISESGQIEGLSLNEALELSQLLNAGRIPLPLIPIFDQTVSPILGADFIDMSVKAGIIGILLVLLFMIAYYRVSGVLASLALVFYGVVVLAVFKLFGVVLTLAGLGGFVLSIGMAVDANVLIFERMKEEIRTGRTLGAAIEAGFNRAWNAIRDSNITTFIVCIILFWVGNSIVGGAAVKGFAVTLGIGVAVSMFSAIVVTRTLLRMFVGGPLSKRTRLFSVSVGKRQ